MKFFYLTKKANKTNRAYQNSSNLKRAIALCLGGTLIFSLSACNDESANEITDAIAESAETLSGDWDSNRVYIIDVDNMELLTSVEGTGDGPYGIDQQGANKAYALTRRTESLTVVDNYTLENTGFIELQHKPRSTNFNANTLLSLVSGGDKAMTSIIRTDMDKVTKVIGEDTLTTPHDFGGSLSTGHPLWVSDHHFFMLDRASRQIQLWNRDGTMLSVIDAPTSIHHIFQPPASTMSDGEQNIFYAVIDMLS
jgi:DNA-binding beta-propeller fold protein YncE